MLIGIWLSFKRPIKLFGTEASLPDKQEYRAKPKSQGSTLNLGTDSSNSLVLVHIRPILGSLTQSTGAIPEFWEEEEEKKHKTSNNRAWNSRHK